MFGVNSSVILCGGLIAVKKKNIDAHKDAMIGLTMYLGIGIAIYRWLSTTMLNLWGGVLGSNGDEQYVASERIERAIQTPVGATTQKIRIARFEIGRRCVASRLTVHLEAKRAVITLYLTIFNNISH